MTSYAILRRDIELYRGAEFSLVILDEAQHIKNRASQNAVAAKALKARHRLILTGHAAGEFDSRFCGRCSTFLLPGYLGTATVFKDRYEVPLGTEATPIQGDPDNLLVRVAEPSGESHATPSPKGAPLFPAADEAGGSHRIAAEVGIPNPDRALRRTTRGLSRGAGAGTPRGVRAFGQGGTQCRAGSIGGADDTVTIAAGVLSSRSVAGGAGKRGKGERKG